MPKSMLKLNEKKLQERINWTPFKAQKDVIRAYRQSRDTTLAAGRRFGKSALCAYLALRELLKDNRHIWIVAPTYGLSEKVFNHLLVFINKGFPSMTKSISLRPNPRITTGWGSWVECKSTENTSGLLGEELDLVILDEAARIKKSVWEGYIFPCLSSRKGKSVKISTPFGKNFFYQEWVRTKEDNASFQFSSLDGVTINKEEWERSRKILPEDVFKQEYQALFLEDAASVFRGVDDVILDGILSDVEKGHYYVVGADFAKHTDFTVITVIDTFNNHLVYFDRFKDIDYNLQKKRLISVAQRYNNARVIVDSNNIGEPISEDLKRAGLTVDNFKFTGKSKPELIEKASIYIEQKMVWVPPIDILIDELKSFGYQLTNPKTGEPLKNIRYSAPQGLHDDCVDSLALAIWGLRGKPSPKTLLQKEMEKSYKPKRTSFI